MDVSSHRHFVNLLNKFRAGALLPYPVVSEASLLVRCQIDDFVDVAAERLHERSMYVRNTLLEYINAA